MIGLIFSGTVLAVVVTIIYLRTAPEMSDDEAEAEEAVAIQQDWERRARHEPDRWW